jgi:rhodanese-related sulfurtransferase
LIDARPVRKYEQATIPGALNLPDTKFAKYYPELEKLGVTKDVEIITFCGGFKCIKSLNDAKMLRDKGFKNVKIYLAGMPDWKKHNVYVEISLAAAYKKLGKATFVDARPARKFKKGTIAGSVNIPDTKFMKKENQAKYLKLLPQDKNAEIIVYCGGYHCIKSHNVANILVKDYGYKNIKVMAAGLPGWKKAGYSAKGTSVKAGKAAATGVVVSGLKPGAEEGTVDKEWFKTIIDPASRPKNIFIVDVRSPSEFEEGHVEGAVNIPVDLIFASDDSGCTVVPPKIDKLTAKGDVIFMCASGGRAGDMYFELKESCNYPKMDKLHFLDAHVDYSSGKCEIK